MIRTITTLLSAGEVAAILARRTLEMRHVETVPDSKITAEMLAVFGPGPGGQPEIKQYRIDVTVDELREEWRG